MGLERRYVTCDQVFALESDQIFSTNWICLAHRSILDNGSGVVPIQFESNRLMLVRSSDGNVKAFRNSCRHRGSQLVTEESCAKIGQRIQCPYHAWTYDRDGTLLAAPNMDDVAGFEAGDFALKPVACESHAGFIWVNFQPANSVQEFLEPLESVIQDWSLDDLALVAELNYEVRANWKLIFQNFNECYHCPTVHPVLNRLTPYRDASNSFETGHILGGPMQLAPDCQTMSTDGQAIAPVLQRLDDRQKRCVNYFTIFPTMFLSTHPDYVMVHRIQRVGVDTTKIACQFLVDPHFAQAAQCDPARAVQFWDSTNRQDWEVCELAQQGMQDPAYTPGPYCNLESVLAAFDQHYFAQLHR